MSSVHHQGEMGKRISAFDWAKTPLGPMESWPQSLRTVVNILLSSRYAMWMAWGPEMTFLCNDAYRPTLGLKEGWALGTPAKQVWAEIWPEIGPRIQSVLTTGVATYDEGLLLILERSGFREESYHTFSYSPLSEQNLKAAIAETGATITTGHLPVVRADRAPLMHVFQNLISNALKYRSDKTPQVRIWSESQNGDWRFAVQDNGIGIAKVYHQQIFGIFKRLHDRNSYPGTGIGLAICQKIVERYGGRIWVDSEPGRGTTIFFTLPKSLEDAG